LSKTPSAVDFILAVSVQAYEVVKVLHRQVAIVGQSEKKDMQGTLQKQKCGYNWMQIGYADTRFSKTILIPSLLLAIFLAIWAYREMPDGKWH